jgi:hypothetical protein
MWAKFVYLLIGAYMSKNCVREVTEITMPIVVLELRFFVGSSNLESLFLMFSNDMLRNKELPPDGIFFATSSGKFARGRQNQQLQSEISSRKKF